MPSSATTWTCRIWYANSITEATDKRGNDGLGGTRGEGDGQHPSPIIPWPREGIGKGSNRCDYVNLGTMAPIIEP